ncbi:hypothetical protein PTKIN_Ptkin16aG0060800 [Pterospermum kingtungense]
MDVIRVRLAHWATTVWPKDQVSMMGAVKFNVDGLSMGKLGLIGIGGVLRDHSGDELARFFKSIGVEDSNFAELMAIREAMVIFVTSPFVL